MTALLAIWMMPEALITITELSFSSTCMRCMQCMAAHGSAWKRMEAQVRKWMDGGYDHDQALSFSSTCVRCMQYSTVEQRHVHGSAKREHQMGGSRPVDHGGITTLRLCSGASRLCCTLPVQNRTVRPCALPPSPLAPCRCAARRRQRTAASMVAWSPSPPTASLSMASLAAFSCCSSSLSASLQATWARVTKVRGEKGSGGFLTFRVGQVGCARKERGKSHDDSPPSPLASAAESQRGWDVAVQSSRLGMAG